MWKRQRPRDGEKRRLKTILSSKNSRITLRMSKLEWKETTFGPMEQKVEFLANHQAKKILQSILLQRNGQEICQVIFLMIFRAQRLLGLQLQLWTDLKKNINLIMSLNLVQAQVRLLKHMNQRKQVPQKIKLKKFLKQLVLILIQVFKQIRKHKKRQRLKLL